MGHEYAAEDAVFVTQLSRELNLAQNDIRDFLALIRPLLSKNKIRIRKMLLLPDVWQLPPSASSDPWKESEILWIDCNAGGQHSMCVESKGTLTYFLHNDKLQPIPMQYVFPLRNALPQILTEASTANPTFDQEFKRLRCIAQAAKSSV